MDVQIRISATEKGIEIHEMKIDYYNPTFTMYETEIDYRMYLEKEEYNNRTQIL